MVKHLAAEEPDPSWVGGDQNMFALTTLQGDNMPMLCLQLVPLPESGKKSHNAALNLH